MAVLVAGVLAVHLWLLYAAPPRPLPIAPGAAAPSWRVSAAPVPVVPQTPAEAPKKAVAAAAAQF